MELEFKIELEDAATAVLVLEVSIETEELSGEAWGRPYSESHRFCVVEDANIHAFNSEGDELYSKSVDDYTQYISDEQVQERGLHD